MDVSYKYSYPHEKVKKHFMGMQVINQICEFKYSQINFIFSGFIKNI